MGKPCTCCGTKCADCICERFLESLEFDFYNKNGYLYNTTIPVNSIIKNICLKYFYIGDATGYYNKDGSRVPYKKYRMEISPTPGTEFTSSLVPCRRKDDSSSGDGISELITHSQIINGKIIIDFPDERFYGNILYGIDVYFNYRNNSFAFFNFIPWSAQDFQEKLRNYENIDASLIGLYPELKQCTVNLISSDLLPGTSLNLSPCSGDLKCVGIIPESREYDFEYYRQICQCQNNNQIDTREIKRIREFIYSEMNFSANLAGYKKTYHGFLLVLRPNRALGKTDNYHIACDIYANISDYLVEYTKPNPFSRKLTIITTEAKCIYDNNFCASPESTLGLNCRSYQLIERIPTEIGSFSKEPVGDLSIVCSKSCFPCSSSGYSLFNPTGLPKSIIQQTTEFQNLPGVLPKYTIRSFDPEILWNAGTCCCSGREKNTLNPSNTGLEIATKIAFFDIAYTTFGGGSCSDLSIVNYAEVRLDLKELSSSGINIHNPIYTNFPTLGRCLSSFPGDFISYLLEDSEIPRIKGFDLSLGDNIGQYYNLKVAQDIDTIPDAFIGTRSQFIFSNTNQETGIDSCKYGSYFDLANSSFKDDRINRQLNFDFGFGSTGESFGSSGISRFETMIFPRAFNYKTSKFIESGKYIYYEDITQLFAKFLPDSLISSDDKFVHDFYISAKILFETNPRYERQIPYLDQGSGLKMTAYLSIGDYLIKSNTVKISQVNDFFQELIFDTNNVGIYEGSILGGGVVFIPDPILYKKILKMKLI